MEPSYDTIYNTESKRTKEAHTIFVEVIEDTPLRDENGKRYSPRKGRLSVWTPLTYSELRENEASMRTASELEMLDCGIYATKDLREKVKGVTERARTATEGEPDEVAQIWRYACRGTLDLRSTGYAPVPCIDNIKLETLLFPEVKVKSEDEDTKAGV